MKEVILTGGSGGIGRSIAVELSTRGYKVINLDLKRPDDLIDFESYIQVDFRDHLATERIINENLHCKNLYGIVHCAGYGGPYQKISQISLDNYNSIININLTSIFLILKKCLPLLANNNFGRVIFISSMLGRVGSANSTIYSAAKHGLNGLMKSIADEWGRQGITANSISPGFVKTAMGIQEDQVKNHLAKVIAKTPAGKIAIPEEIARVVSFLIHENSSYINGADWVVDGGMTAI